MDSMAKFCGHCGAQLAAGAGFCHQCGTSAGAVPESAGGAIFTGPIVDPLLPPQPPPSPPGSLLPPPLPGGIPPAYAYGAPYQAQRAKSDTRVLWIIIGVACGIPLLAIIGIIASITLPIMLSSRQGDVREEARNALRTVVSAEFAYYASNGQYASTLAELSTAGMLSDPSFASGSLPHGISLTLTASGQSFTATATCTNPPCAFTTDESGEIK